MNSLRILLSGRTLRYVNSISVKLLLKQWLQVKCTAKQGTAEVRTVPLAEGVLRKGSLGGSGGSTMFVLGPAYLL